MLQVERKNHLKFYSERTFKVDSDVSRSNFVCKYLEHYNVILCSEIFQKNPDVTNWSIFVEFFSNLLKNHLRFLSWHTYFVILQLFLNAI